MTTPLPDWDPRDPAILQDQRAAYDAMRQRCPVAYSEFLGWSLFRHDDIERVLDDPATFRSASRHRAVPNSLDPPEHTLFRQAIEPFFEAETMLAFEPRCRTIAAELTVNSIRRGELEFAQEFAEHFALRSACAFLGWPEDDWIDLQGWTHGNQDAALSRDRAAGQALAAQLERHVDTAIRARRAGAVRSDHDLTACLMATQVDGQALSDDDIVSILRNWIAGHGTVAAGLGILVFHLAQDLDLQHRLRADPALIGPAVDEILRVDDPLVANRRTTAHAVDIGERHIPVDAKLTLMWIAANRDENAFASPDVIDLDRDQRQNLVFGAGIHDCVGAPLARLELRVALEELLGQTSAIAPGTSDAPVRAVYPGNGFRKLPISLAGA